MHKKPWRKPGRLLQLTVDSKENPPHVKLPYITHPRRIWTFLIATTAIAAIAFGAGYFVRSPQASILNAADKQVPVYAAAEMRVINQGLVAQALVVAGANVDVDGTSVTEANRSVVTDCVLETGLNLTFPAYLGGVSGRPLFALSLAIPLYRDLHFLDTGPDVVSLQSALGVEQTGTFDADTRDAFFRLYDDRDLDPPGATYWQSYVRMSEIVVLPTNGTVPIVAQFAPLGTVLSDTVKLVTLQTGPEQIAFRADVQEIAQLQQGATVTVSGRDGEESSAVVSSIGDCEPAQEAENGTNGAVAGYKILVDFVGETSAEAFTVGQSVTVTTSTEKNDPQLSIPILAIRQDSSGAYVIRRTSDNRSASVRIDVIEQGDGWASITPGIVNEGDEIKVAP